MDSTDKSFTGSIPQIYQRLLVPLIFVPYARDLAERIARARPRKLLETAAGTGVVTRELAARLPADTGITATDLNEPMLAQAKAALPDPRVEGRQADALALPFDDASFDVVACQFGVMFFPDRVKGHAEARRVLTPGGRLFFNVWDRIETSEFTDTVVHALAEIFPNDPPRFLARTPHGYHHVGTVERDLARGGFNARAVVNTVGARSKAKSPRDPAIAYCQGTPLRGEIEARGAARLGEATDVAAAAVAKRFGPGAVDGKIQAHVISIER
jgi:SAM-dependent methyltransferase